MCRRLRSGQQQYCIDTGADSDAYTSATFTSISTTINF